jgi:hypothetical protein
MGDVQSEISQTLKHGNSIIGVEMGCNNILRFIEKPDPRILFHWGVGSSLSTDLN